MELNGGMTVPLRLLGVDLGASSGRVMLGEWDNGKITLGELHRFENTPVAMLGRLYWDAPRTFHEILEGVSAGVASGQVNGIGIDTWGVDYGLLSAQGRLIENPVHYRDTRTDGMMDKAFETVPKREIYAQTGLAFMQFNTLYQLIASKLENDEALANARTLLFTPDLYGYYLTGEMGAEYTIASTSQMIDSGTRDWAWPLIERFGLPAGILPKIQMPGVVRGALLPEILRRVGAGGGIPLIAVGGHDTASAVVATPAKGTNFAYISSGTWSLLGTELPAPIATDQAMDANFTNEGGVAGTIRVLKNVMGLWIIQECRREWLKDDPEISFADIVALAEKAEPFIAMINPDDDLFFHPGGMPGKILEYIKQSGQKTPDGIGGIARVVYESLALRYRWTIERMSETTGRKFDVLHVVGGGAKNALLNQMTANALHMPVLAGPSEATVLGNLMTQALALGEVSSLSEIRAAIARSFPPEEFLPAEKDMWDDAYARFLAYAR